MLSPRPSLDLKVGRLLAAGLPRPAQTPPVNFLAHHAHHAHRRHGPGSTDRFSSAASRTYTGATTYTVAGVYHVSATATDGDAAAATRSADVVCAIYDPAAGFVAGGGFIDSPAGAFAGDAMVTGKAIFGEWHCKPIQESHWWCRMCLDRCGSPPRVACAMVVMMQGLRPCLSKLAAVHLQMLINIRAFTGFVIRYNTKGAPETASNTVFEFEAAGLRFKSTRVEQIVVSGTKASFKVGVGLSHPLQMWCTWYTGYHTAYLHAA